MFGKLMKYDFKSMGRLILPCYAASIALAILSKIFIAISSALSGSYGSDIAQIFSSILNMLVGIFGFLIFAIVLLIIFFTIRSFYFTFSSKNGYLSFSLPVSANQHLLSHLLVSVIYIIGSYIVTCISMVILFFEYLKEIPTLFQTLSAENATSSFWLLVLVFIIIGILGIFTLQMQFYSSIAIGSQFKKSRVMGSVLGYFVISMVQSFLSPFLMFFVTNTMLNSSQYTYSRFETLKSTLDTVLQLILQFSIPMIIFGLIIFLAEYFFSRYIFTKRLNLV